LVGDHVHPVTLFPVCFGAPKVGALSDGFDPPALQGLRNL